MSAKEFLILNRPEQGLEIHIAFRMFYVAPGGCEDKRPGVHVPASVPPADRCLSTRLSCSRPLARSAPSPVTGI